MFHMRLSGNWTGKVYKYFQEIRERNLPLPKIAIEGPFGTSSQDIFGMILTFWLCHLYCLSYVGWIRSYEPFQRYQKWPLGGSNFDFTASQIQDFYWNELYKFNFGRKIDKMSQKRSDSSSGHKIGSLKLVIFTLYLRTRHFWYHYVTYYELCNLELCQNHKKIIKRWFAVVLELESPPLLRFYDHYSTSTVLK